MNQYLLLLLSFMKIGAFSFGGGYAMIPLISRVVVTERGWLSELEFIDVIAISEATPGPIAINSATYVGYKVGGVLGSAVATLGVVLPSFIIMLILGALFLRYKEVPVVRDMLSGIRPVVAALVVNAALSVMKTSLEGFVPVAVAGLVIVLILKYKKDPIKLLMLAGLSGLILYR